MGSERCTKIILAVAFVLGLAAAQSPVSVWDGVYSDRKPAAGLRSTKPPAHPAMETNYRAKGRRLRSTGSDFVMDWSGMTVGDLFDKMQTSMPADKPGSLSREQNASLVAYLLSANKFPSGMAELSSDAERLQQIRFEATRAK